MKTRYGLSPWIHQFPASRVPDEPRLKGDHRAPVVIVGAGLTGCATAYAFAAAGVPVLVLDADRIGRGATGHGAGLLLADPGPSFADTENALGRRAARTMFQAWRRATLDAAATLRRLGIPCGLDACDSIEVAIDREEEKRLLRGVAARTDAGLEVTVVKRQPLGRETALDALVGARTRDGFVLDPYRAAVGLARAARGRGARFFERSAVTRVTTGRRDVAVLTREAAVTADTVIVTTGVPTPEFRQLRRHFTPRDTYLVLTDAMPAAMRKQLGPQSATIRDLREPRHRVRFAADRILVSGADQPPPPARQRDAVLIQRTGQLMYELLTLYPAIRGLQPAYGWSLTTADAADGLPCIGAHRNFPRHLFALGAAGDGVTGAFLAARVLLRRYQDAADKSDAYWGFSRG